jgi:hypothetical protein
VARAMASVAPARVMARLARGLRRLAGVGGLRLNLHGWNGGLSGTIWLWVRLESPGTVT